VHTGTTWPWQLSVDDAVTVTLGVTPQATVSAEMEHVMEGMVVSATWNTEVQVEPRPDVADVAVQEMA